jgi:hypothetical protein
MRYIPPVSLEEKRQRIMRERHVTWHEASRILSLRSAAVRHYRAQARAAKIVRPTPVVPYAGPGVVVVSPGESTAGGTR